MTQFVIVGTMLRGVVTPAEPLDDANQWRAFSAWRQEQNREIRAGYELAVLGENAEWELEAQRENRVVWSKNRGPRRPVRGDGLRVPRAIARGGCGDGMGRY